MSGSRAGFEGIGITKDCAGSKDGGRGSTGNVIGSHVPDYIVVMIKQAGNLQLVISFSGL